MRRGRMNEPMTVGNFVAFLVGIGIGAVILAAISYGR
jgi:hypothetical protein